MTKSVRATPAAAGHGPRMSDQLGGLISSEHTHNPSRDQELRFCPLTWRRNGPDWIAPAEQGVPQWKRNVAQRGDALELLRSLPDACAAVVFFDPQHRGVFDKLKFGNEGARQRERCALPAMSEDYIDACCREIARVLAPSGYCMRWIDTYGLCEAHHQRVADCLKGVDIIAWDNLRMGMGYRTRRRGDYVLVLQKPPITATTWSDHGIPSRWPEKVDRKIHPHMKPAGLIARLIGAVTQPGDLVVDPAAGSFVVMHVAIKMGRQFTGCDKAYRNSEVFVHSTATVLRAATPQLVA
jgi:site-specific DNA-methyltransferase (adenine-specific)